MYKAVVTFVVTTMRKPSDFLGNDSTKWLKNPLVVTESHYNQVTTKLVVTRNAPVATLYSSLGIFLQGKALSVMIQCCDKRKSS